MKFFFVRYVLLRKPVKENCTERREFCEVFRRTHVFHSETVFCEQKYKIDCPEAPREEEEEEEEGADEKKTCLPRRLAVCRTVPEKVTLTERKQKCNGEEEHRTTKMCYTYEDGSGE